MSPALDSLVRCAQAGDQSAFHEVAETFRPPLVRYVRSLLRDPGITDDVVQETLVTAWHEIRRVRDGTHLQPWLYRVARNKAVSAMRSRGRGIRTRSLAFMEHDRDVPAVQQTHTSYTRSAARSDLQCALRLAIARLPERYVAVVRLHYLHRCTTREAADLLNMNRSTVKMRLMRARELLGELLPDAIATIGGRAARELSDLIERRADTSRGEDPPR